MIERMTLRLRRKMMLILRPEFRKLRFQMIDDRERLCGCRKRFWLLFAAALDP
jgi:hypothetical protein